VGLGGKGPLWMTGACWTRLGAGGTEAFDARELRDDVLTAGVRAQHGGDVAQYVVGPR
jgi:hypothetical protein